MRVFILCTHSVSGALPLGIVITSDEQMETLTKAFQMLKSIFPDNSFYGKGRAEVIMTDNCSELREALYEVFPDATLLLCTFHILQQVWRWLFDKNHAIQPTDRIEIMQFFRKIVHVREIVEFEEMLTEFFESSCLTKYPGAVLYFEGLGMYVLVILF